PPPPHAVNAMASRAAQSAHAGAGATIGRRSIDKLRAAKPATTDASLCALTRQTGRQCPIRTVPSAVNQVAGPWMFSVHLCTFPQLPRRVSTRIGRQMLARIAYLGRVFAPDRT